MDNMEGGLAYLQDVIINDALGINQSLEEHMQSVVDTYQCEWKSVVQSPSARKRFRQFVNSDAKDSYQLFVEQRGQVRPATEAEKAQNITVKELL
jgi:nitrite reductase (NADH) large subunit